MRLERSLIAAIALMFLVGVSLGQDRSTGAIKGKVRVETGTPAGVTVVIRQGERAVNNVATDKSGAFQIRLPPGIYGLTF
ncbi:MAG TPA: carboxypeptidase-like regulatory domain-containing protein, partial [Pyrinomonadaceae bacterium]|nr:carboxypeptidase-like regulatory domain-containing protein [Pyrinomonadaceae bacterium]